ncbi:hypothetical protein Q31b_58610 [Novipirellula aureliae]|uniref:Uncharacterized protein n=1 Tax=Novipirellula aureliae TaxID=2527966 RepID=A0A5C6D862_9BACT|nr:hypothetical protein [Novipirellula aureliae]TWU31931.1 hypothetical protein Q31b_58610 [Novipirellula aureliae]
MSLDIDLCDQQLFEFLKAVHLCRIANDYSGSFVESRFDREAIALLQFCSSSYKTSHLMFYATNYLRSDASPLLLGGILNALAESYSVCVRCADQLGKQHVIEILRSMQARIRSGELKTRLGEWPIWMRTLITCRDQNAMRIGLDLCGLTMDRERPIGTPDDWRSRITYEKRLDTITSLCVRQPELNANELGAVRDVLEDIVASLDEPQEIKYWADIALTKLG